MTHPRFRSALWATYAVTSIVYLAWRGAATLNGEHPLYAGLFFIAEIYSILSSLAFYGLIVRRADPPELPAPDCWPSIDVLIATYNEDVALVRTTAVAARDLYGEHRTWICDDGHRSHIEELAREIGVGYITRADNAHFKAGNLNNALQRTGGELLLVLDADHVPQRRLLTRLVPYFSDPELALVQIPQVYYNIDSYQHDLSIRKRKLWHEASVFHHLMQPGANQRGASFFVGTGAVLRRAALERVGGFATGSITEDIHTSMRLHAAGYRSLYVDEPLGYLLAPDTPYAYANQRLRWAQGAMQILRRENPLLKPGLSLWQRIGYLNSLSGYLSAYQHLLFYVSPALFLLFGLSPIAVDPRLALPVFVGHIVVDVIVYKLLARPYARLFLGECYKILGIALHVRASVTLARSDGLPFRVTPKGRHGGLPPSLVLPAMGLFAVNLTAVGIGLTRLSATESHLGAVLLTTFFAAMFAVAGALALIHAYERRSVHDAFSFPVNLAGSFINRGENRQVALRRINHQSVYVLTAQALDDQATGTLDLSAMGLSRPVAARVEGSEPTAGGTVVKFALIDLQAVECDQLDRFLFEQALPRLFGQFESDGQSGAQADWSDQGPMPTFLHLRSSLV